MRRFAGALWLQLGRVLRQGSILACLLLAVLLTLLLGIFLPADNDDSMRVGVYMPPDSVYGQEIWTVLQSYSEGGSGYVLAESPQQVEEMVGARAWECGFVFHEEMDVRLENGEYKRLITRVVSPASVPLFSGWTLSAALLEVCAPDIAAAFLEQSGLPGQGEEVEALAQGFFGVESTMEVEVRQIQGGGAALETGGLTGTMLTRGLVALLLFVVCCLGAVRHASDMESGFFIRLAPYTGTTVLFFSSYVALGLLCAATGLVCLGLEGLFFGIGYGGFGYQAAVLLLYLIYLGAVSFLLAALFRKGDGILFLMPILIIACLLLSPIFFDIGQLVPTLRPVTAIFPTTLYLRGAAGTMHALWQMPLWTAVCLAVGALVLWLRRLQRGKV